MPSFKLSSSYLSPRPPFLFLLSHRRSWPSDPEILTQWRVWKQTRSTPSPWPPSQTKASELSPMNWCRGRHKLVCLSLTGFTHTNTHKHLNGHFAVCLSLVQITKLPSTHIAFSTLSSAPDLLRPGNHLRISPSISFINPSVRHPLPSIYVWLCLSFCAQPLASWHSPNIMTDGDGAPINVSLFRFLYLPFTFSTLSVSNVFERAKMSATYWLAASGEEHWRDWVLPTALTGKCQSICILVKLN